MFGALFMMMDTQLENEQLLAEANAKKIMPQDPSKNSRKTPPRAARKIKQAQRIGLPG